MSNIYFGAHLKQHIVGHKGIQKFSLQEREHQGLYREAMKRTIMGAVFHHQAVPEEKAATEHLEPAVIYDGLVKAAEPRMGGSSPMVLLQFHPEFLGMTTAHSWKRELIDTGLTLAMSKDNEKFWKILGDSAATYRNKQRVLQEIRKGGDALKRGLKGPDGSSSSAVTEPEA